MKYDKLIRDKIPQIIKKSGSDFRIRKASKSEYYKKLKEKLLEETREFLKDQSIEELVDILEVVYALSQFRGTSPKTLEKLRKSKAAKRGAFKKMLILLETTFPKSRP